MPSSDGDFLIMNDLPIPFIQSSSYPVRHGNRIHPLIDGVPTFRRICEAIEAATHCVWGTVTFMWATFEMPDGRGTALDVLDRAAARGVDVRLLFWRPDPETENLKRNAFWGSADHFHQLEARRSGVQIRWDRSHPGFCQHQKSWLIDTGEENETAFVGGINLNPFVQRWNEASERFLEDERWGRTGSNDPMQYGLSPFSSCQSGILGYP